MASNPQAKQEINIYKAVFSRNKRAFQERARRAFGDFTDGLKPILNIFKENEEKIGLLISNGILNKHPIDTSITCKVCFRTKIEDSVFCEKHTKAYSNLEAGFQHWKNSLGFQWPEYLKKIDKIPGTGEYIIEILGKISD